MRIVTGQHQSVLRVPFRRPPRTRGIARIVLALLWVAMPTGADGPDPSETAPDSVAPATEESSSDMTTHEAPTRQPNRLSESRSPYLLQHQYNPVDWYPWGEEALEKARSEDKPIFLSIGYSACHWCHVMAHESFEDEETAAILNEHFVNIKVDREERPDIDSIYMSAVQITTGSGGWPMSVFLTPDLKPFYAGTYFPPRDMYGRPGFKTVLRGVIEAWRNRRADIEQSAEEIAGYVRQSMQMRTGAEKELTPDLLAGAARDLERTYDPTYGGFGSAPKFPSSASIQVLLRRHARTGDAGLLDMATSTLRHMALGGIYDHLGGGFHRYSVDAAWLVPHFEKMLYDQAQLVEAYLEAFQVTGDPLFRRVAQETLDYVLRDMRDPDGGFHSAEDADSEGQEGLYYLWTRAAVDEILGPDDAAVFCTYYNVREGGNFSSPESYHGDRNILHVPRPPEAVAEELGMDVEDLEARLEPLRDRLREVRETRVRPSRDDKVLASWNALMITAFAKGYAVLGDERYLRAANEAADFILSRMVRDGGLLHTYRAGEADLPGYLDDYAFLAAALVDLYEASFNPERLHQADELIRRMDERFWDDAHGGYFFTGAEHKNLIARNKPVVDGAEPSGNSVAALTLLRLARLRDNADYARRAEKLLRINHVNLSSSPQAFMKMMVAVDFLLHPPKEIAIAGQPNASDVRALLEVVHKTFVPSRVLALIDPVSGDAERLERDIPLLQGKIPINGQAAAYVCRNFTCDAPVVTPDALKEALLRP